MSVYFLGGKGQVPAEVYVRLPKRGEAAKRAAIYSHVFDALFPGAQAEKRAKAIDSFDAPFFYEMLPMPRGLNPVLGFLDWERRALITNVDVYARLEEPHDFDPVILLGGVKPNTHFWVTPEGQVMEFTSSVPLEAAKKEVAPMESSLKFVGRQGLEKDIWAGCGWTNFPRFMNYCQNLRAFL
ncbi:MAG: hypothetical protein NT099_02360 [Candidatus Saganbacteria bacterium]|nr:hypothetical protein [Candidatus Saganbacteria bacterium]